ncbi:hypothetical protein SD427_18685 (plasmid) [Chryseobacterium sp. JJR-5R]|uniref:hypothetical protein n=1 Tax=Chryseobacterium sp. JJR-5R TaxID=3093923 RepID=UPI002A75BE85|nr:hypothetical protein [Chryseobacterium sp. JJR-5R]WPO84626.1 hypothetical protein SD427_18685 [Chryseobacterium sp. JJR-5R]
MTIKDRILIFLAEKSIKKEAFYADINMSASNFKGQALHSDLGVDKLARILSLYPELNSTDNLIWLITGKGKLNLNEEVVEKENDQQDADHNKTEELGNVLASMFALTNVHSKDLSFIMNQIEKVSVKLSELEKKTDMVVKYMSVDK